MYIFLHIAFFLSVCSGLSAPTLGGMVPPSKSSFVLCCLRINVRDPIRYGALLLQKPSLVKLYRIYRYPSL
ncbi:hypothetical protein POTOM_053027 [Populus tomentosa]|uniref:Secreted protein n=1 Tax=Populus tomentosa TaxID=118781 RepID=A0A8X7Y0Q5_POPTO|nr:hypothetical protein POTOM_053027 [Populus tomentosa]